MSALSSQAFCGIDRHKCVALSCPVGVTIGEFCWYFYPLEGWETLKHWNLSAAAGWLLQQQSQHKLTELVSRAERCWGNGGLASPFHHLSRLLCHFCLLCHRSSAEAPWWVHVMGPETSDWNFNLCFPVQRGMRRTCGVLSAAGEDLWRSEQSGKERQTLRTTQPQDLIGRGLHLSICWQISFISNFMASNVMKNDKSTFPLFLSLVMDGGDVHITKCRNLRIFILLWVQ